MPPRDSSVPAPGSNASRLVLALVVAALAGVQLLPFLNWSPERLAVHGLLPDDAFFYSVLARNAHDQGILSLDGEMPTNGFHPLWMGLQMLLVKLAPKADEAVLLCRSAWASYLLFCLAAIWWGVRLRGRGGIFATLVLGGLLLANVSYQSIVVHGMETPLILLCLCLTLPAIERAKHAIDSEKRSVEVARSVILLALAGAFCFFARTDWFWMALVLFLWLLTRRTLARRQLLLYLAVLASLVVPYLAYNYAAHGSPVPISGRAKMYYCQSFFPTLQAYLASNEWHGALTAFSTPVPFLGERTGRLAAWTLLVLGVAYYIVWWRARSRPEFHGLRLLGLAVLGHLFTLQLFYRELAPYTAYYFAPDVLWAGLVLARAVGDPRVSRAPTGAKRSRPRPRSGPARQALALGLVLAAGAVAASSWSRRNLQPIPYWNERLNLAHDIERTIPAGEPIGAFWPGFLAQFAGRPVTPLDGVIGSGDYFDRYVKTGREIDYLLERGRSHLVIRLNSSLEKFLGDTPPSIKNWTALGERRLWERRRDLALAVVAYRPLNAWGGGWYLLKLSPKQDSR